MRQLKNRRARDLISDCSSREKSGAGEIVKMCSLPFSDGGSENDHECVLAPINLRRGSKKHGPLLSPIISPITSETFSFREMRSSSSFFPVRFLPWQSCPFPFLEAEPGNSTCSSFRRRRGNCQTTFRKGQKGRGRYFCRGHQKWAMILDIDHLRSTYGTVFLLTTLRQFLSSKSRNKWCCFHGPKSWPRPFSPFKALDFLSSSALSVSGSNFSQPLITSHCVRFPSTNADHGILKRILWKERRKSSPIGGLKARTRLETWTASAFPIRKFAFFHGFRETDNYWCSSLIFRPWKCL